MLCPATPNISRARKNTNSTAHVSRLSFRFLRPCSQKCFKSIKTKIKRFSLSLSILFHQSFVSIFWPHTKIISLYALRNKFLRSHLDPFYFIYRPIIHCTHFIFLFSFFFFCFFLFNTLNLFKLLEYSRRNKYLDFKEKSNKFFTITIIFVKTRFTVMY